MKETLQQNDYSSRFLCPQCSPPRKDREEKDDPRSHVTIPYIQGVSETVNRILSDINVQVHMSPSGYLGEFSPGVESHYWSRISREAIYIYRQPSSLTRDRGTHLICMILSYCDCPSPSQLKEVKPYDYEPISLDCLISIYVCCLFCNSALH